MEEMRTLPFFKFHYKGHQLKRQDELCAETGNDCYKFANKYLSMKWNNAYNTKTTWTDNFLDSHACTPDDIG